MQLKYNELAGNLLQQMLRINLGTRVILVRHGESTFNAQGRHQGSSDESVLTEIGRSAARQTGTFLRGITFDAVYTSSLKRTQETASEMLAMMEPAIELNKIHTTYALREIDLPAWQGLSHREVQEKFAQDYRCWRQCPHEFRMATPEQYSGLQPDQVQQPCAGSIKDAAPLCSGSINAAATQTKPKGLTSLAGNPLYTFPVLDLYSRAQQFWQEILPDHRNQTLLIVSHSGTIRALIATALGLTPERYHALQQSNCGISILNFPDGYQAPAQLEALNLTTHLGETLPPTKADPKGLRLLLVPSGNEAQMRRVAQLLKTESIHFSISGTDHEAEAIATTILQYHPATVQLQVLRDDFPQVWQQAITARSSLTTNSSQLITGLVVGINYIIQRLIRQVLGMNCDEIGNLQLRQGAVSVIHYPLAERSPMLQAMNIAG
ncbi:histidine phosphatase family protein [Microseira wollei]|uniref:Phosphoglycerate mutase, putative n=1 Tax=Microseira wollei NIES-4236 TaxID=2530354 RepID=A0AAV3X5B0_9CYAN|nr:histidine phosphatase family protein [Microseira wollei]GET36995.1 phosphoglycerate mutase, putative [Microseira wollei NIES-4236]